MSAENNLHRTALFRLLKKKDEKLAARVSSVRDEAEKWLPYIIRIFPHHPQHGVEHSDRIIGQLSLLLFDGTKPSTAFSGAEIYCLLCAAYLHDTGMVVTQNDLTEIATTPEWVKYTSAGGTGHSDYLKFEALQKDLSISKPEQRAFLSYSILSQLIADFIRRSHHKLGKRVLELHPFLRELVDFADSVAFETIADIGVGHGLPSSELSDETRYPEERLVLGEKVNVRFLTRLLRIGDLLDMSAQRAAPMAAKAVAPLPPDARPHWQQYSHKKHENISPKVIEYRFECSDQETHRILRDWFSWLESEVNTIGLEQMHSVRHTGWNAPRCVVSSYQTADAKNPADRPTIIVKPATGAAYTFHDWRLQLDQERVLQLLIFDVYSNATVFVRELLQNALDATRCQMYQDYAEFHSDLTPPTYPSGFEPAFREKYPVSLSLKEELVKSSPDDEPRNCLVFEIEDHGTGMSEHVITQYFLQIGRSYYNSAEFHEKFKFSPTSRFGIGFLTVFGASNDIAVETATSNTASSASGIRLRLRGPKNYLLTEKWDPFPEREKRERHGTRIRVILNPEITSLGLLELVQKLCVRVEVPIQVSVNSETAKIEFAPLVDGEVLATAKADPNGRFIQRVFPINNGGVEGELAVCAYVDGLGEGWCDCWSSNKGLNDERIDKLPRTAGDFFSLHGIYVGQNAFSRGYMAMPQWTVRIDVRAPRAKFPISRKLSRGEIDLSSETFPKDELNIEVLATSKIYATAEAVVSAHLKESSRSQGTRGYYYRNRVLSTSPLSNTWRDQYPGTILTWQSGVRVDCTASTLLSFERIGLIYCEKTYPKDKKASIAEMVAAMSTQCSSPLISFGDTPTFIDSRLKKRISSMKLSSLVFRDDLWLLEFSQDRNIDITEVHPDTGWWLVKLNEEKSSVATINASIGSISSEMFCLLNRDHPIVDWLTRLNAAANETPPRVDISAVNAAWKRLASEGYQMDELILRWRNNEKVPEDLKPPGADILEPQRVLRKPGIPGWRYSTYWHFVEAPQTGAH